MRNTYACLLSVMWVTVPVLASANTWPEFGARWVDRDEVSQPRFKQDSVVRTVADHRLGRDDRFGSEAHNRSSREAKESRATTDTGRERSHESARSDKTPLSLSKDYDHPFDSVHRPAQRPDPWWGRRTEGDPMIKGLNRSPSGK